MSKDKELKTNALRLLENAGIPCRVFAYDVSDGKLDAASMAKKMAVEPEVVFKTLVTVNPAKEYFVFVIPGPTTLDLKKAAAVSGSKSIEMIKQKELLPLTGYIHGGCSPVGMKKSFPTFIDESALLFDLIRVSAGHIGFCVEIAPTDLAGFTNARFADITL